MLPLIEWLKYHSVVAIKEMTTYVYLRSGEDSTGKAKFTIMD